MRSIPETLWLVFSRRWLPMAEAPPDAEQWCERGYLHRVAQGKILGYGIALPGYAWILDSVGDGS